MMKLTLALVIAATTASASDLPQDEQPCNLPKHGKCFFRSPEYRQAGRYYKERTLWKYLVDRQGGESEEPEDFMWAETPQFFTQRAMTSFGLESDLLPDDRPKSVHTQGVIAKVSYVPTENNDYWGILGSGSDTVLMRLSEANNLFDEADGLTPAIALKFFVDGRHSQNIFAQDGFLPSGSWNFLENPLSNRFKAFDTETETGQIMDQTFRKKMIEGSQRPFGLAITHLTTGHNDGTVTPDLDLHRMRHEDNYWPTPYTIIFQSPFADRISSEKEFVDGKQVPWYEQLKREIKEGDVIYDVIAHTGPLNPELPDRWRGEVVKIGEIRLQTDLTLSRRADNELFFQHRQIYRDRRFWPKQWKTRGGLMLDEDQFFDKRDPEQVYGTVVPEGWPEDDDEAKEKWIEQVHEFGCPFEWLLKEYL